MHVSEKACGLFKGLLKDAWEFSIVEERNYTFNIQFMRKDVYVHRPLFCTTEITGVELVEVDAATHSFPFIIVARRPGF